MMKYFVTATLTLLAAITSLFVWRLGVFSKDHLPHYTIDVSISDVSYERYNAKGALILTLNAPTLEHNTSSRTMTISSPHIINHPNPKDTWEIWADKAQSDEHYHTIVLKGHVKMKQTRSHSGAPIILSTSAITLVPKKNAITHSPVIATQGASSLRAQGARLDFKTNTLELLGKTDVVEHPMLHSSVSPSTRNQSP